MRLADRMEAHMRALPVPAGVAALAADILARHGKAVQAILFYGSCRRKQDVGDGLADLLVLVDSYRAVHGMGPMALANWLLPPNVYYLEVNAASRRIPPSPPSLAKGGTPSPPPSSEGGTGGMPSAARYRSKYAIVTLTAFERRCRRGLDGYFWARFAQPAQLAFTRNGNITSRIARARADAAARFVARAAGLITGEVDAEEFWTRALATSYRCELRPERPEAAARLIRAEHDYYRELAAQTLPALPFVTTMDANRYRFAPPLPRRLAARCEWFARRAWGKTLNLARLFKAAGTFSGGIDYLVWKIERHSGVRIEPTEFMRRHPRLAASGLAWRVWRQGALR